MRLREDSAQLDYESKKQRKAQEVIKKLERDHPQLYTIYKEAIVGRNPLALKEKTKSQFNDLKQKFGIKRYKKFLNYVNNFIILRYDKYQGEDFLSPIYTGNQTGGGHYGDQVVKAQNYVYASYNTIPHYMTKIKADDNVQEYVKQDENLHCIDDGNFEGKAEIVFSDIDNLMHGAISFDPENKDKLLEVYMNNCFEYVEGKKLLALYLSIIFEKIEDIPCFFSFTNEINIAEGWHSLDHVHGDNELYYTDPMKLEKQEERLRRTLKKIKEVYKQTGLIPPYTLEVRIQDKAKKANIDILVQKQKESYQAKIKGILDYFSKK